MGNLYLCICPEVNDKSASIDVNINHNEQKNSRNDKKSNKEEHKSIEDIQNYAYIQPSNKAINNNIINNFENSIEGKNNNINPNNSSSIFNSSQPSFNKNKSITPSNNPLDGLVKVIPKIED